jgi:hypothetical protein
VINGSDDQYPKGYRNDASRHFYTRIRTLRIPGTVELQVELAIRPSWHGARTINPFLCKCKQNLLLKNWCAGKCAKMIDAIKLDPNPSELLSKQGW